MRTVFTSVSAMSFVPFQRCFHQCRRSVRGPVINVGPILQKYVDHFRKPGAASLHQRRLEGFVFGVYVGAVVQQYLDHPIMVTHRCGHQRVVQVPVSEPGFPITLNRSSTDSSRPCRDASINSSPRALGNSFMPMFSVCSVSAASEFTKESVRSASRGCCAFG